MSGFKLLRNPWGQPMIAVPGIFCSGAWKGRCLWKRLATLEEKLSKERFPPEKKRDSRLLDNWESLSPPSYTSPLLRKKSGARSERMRYGSCSQISLGGPFQRPPYTPQGRRHPPQEYAAVWLRDQRRACLSQFPCPITSPSLAPAYQKAATIILRSPYDRFTGGILVLHPKKDGPHFFFGLGNHSLAFPFALAYSRTGHENRMPVTFTGISRKRGSARDQRWEDHRRRWQWMRDKTHSHQEKRSRCIGSGCVVPIAPGDGKATSTRFPTSKSGEDAVLPVRSSKHCHSV